MSARGKEGRKREREREREGERERERGRERVSLATVSHGGVTTLSPPA